MASSKSRGKLAVTEDVSGSIERWQADTSLRQDDENGAGLIGSLFNSIIELLGLLLIDMRTQPKVSRYYASLESSAAALFFWGSDLDVSRGELDDELHDSPQLRDTCLLVLISIGQFITSSLMCLLSSKDRREELLRSTTILASLEQAMNVLDQRYTLTNHPEQDEEALCRTLRLKVDNLILLGFSLASPAKESFDDEEPRTVEQSDGHLPEQAFTNSIAQRFPRAEPAIVTRLGRLNWERYDHMLQLQRTTSQKELEVTVIAKAKTVFHDSAIGSSALAPTEAEVNTTTDKARPESAYASSMASSRAEACHRRLPPLPPQARSGSPFTCLICNKQVRYDKTKAWKKHIFEDILAYACPFAGCSISGVFFQDRHAMMDHIEQRHGLDVLAGKVTCPICIEYSSTDRHTLSSHFARHMEEIALAIIPSAVESDYDSANETPSETQTDNIEDEPLPPQDYNSRSKVEAAYRYFGYDTPIITDLRDEHIVSKFKDFTAILSPALAEKARRQLQIIGNARNSAWIRATAGVALQHKVRVTPAHQSPGHPILDRFGATRLARESEKGNMEGVKEAYNEAPEELNYPDYAGITPLQKAAFRGWEDIVQYLLHKGCDTTCESGDRDTPLIDAVENSHLEVVRALLKANVDPHHINKRGQRAIDVLDYKDEDADEIVMLLRDAMGKHKHTEASPLKTSQLLYNEYNVETLEAKAASGDTGAVGELISSNIKPNLACGIAAAKGGHYNIFSIFLASGLRADYDPAKHKQTPMTAAIEGGHLQIVRLLLEQDGFNPTRRDSDDRTYYERAEGGKRLKNWKRLHDTLESAFMEYALRNKNIRPAEGPGPGPGPGPVVSYVQTEPMASSHTATQSPGPAPDRSPKIPHLPTVYPYSPSDLGVTGPWAPGLPKPIVVHDQTNLVGQNDYLALPSNTVDAETWISEASGFTHCDHCGAKFTGRYQRSSYARHVRQQHSEKEVQISANCVCRICAQQFKRQDARRRHEWDKHKLPDTKPLLRRPSKAVTANKVVSGVNEVNASEDDVP